ncbi:unnamed protein product [Schistosoma turkestanicum]|nr:unnamed protein product [Schistosoma turkestanicum]
MLIPNKQMTVKERKHDYLYDPLYSLSSAADHKRVMAKNQTDVSKLEKLFSFDNLFCEIPVYRSYMYRLNQNDPVPMSVSRQFRPVDVCKELVKIQLRKGEGPMDGHIFEGMDRWKYFTYSTSSLCPYPSGDPKSLDITLNALRANQNITQEELTPKPPVYVSRHVQTMYRDSEAQTDPYSPPYVIINPGENPEVLKLTSFTYGHGLPAGLFEVEKIERDRQRREIEENLPPFREIADNPAQIAKRRKILESLENREWYYREKEVEAIQEVRLTVITQLLRKREQRKEEEISKRLDQNWRELCAQKDAKCKAIKYRYIEGCYLCRVTYIRTGEPEIGSTYKPVFKVVYYRGIRFHASSNQISMFTAPSDPSSIVTVLSKSHQSLVDISVLDNNTADNNAANNIQSVMKTAASGTLLEGTYEWYDHDSIICTLHQLTRKENQPPTRKRRCLGPVIPQLTVTFTIKFKIGNKKGCLHNRLLWDSYVIHTFDKSSENESTTVLELTNQHFPPCRFVRVRNFIPDMTVSPL